MNNSLSKKLIILGVLGLLAVAIGAFGAHGIKPKISASSMNSFQTGVQYHFIHTLAGFACIMLSKLLKISFNRAFWCFVIGIILFSGSIYLLSTNDLHQLNISTFLGPLTPIGGIFFILGWLLIIITSLKASKADL